MYCSIITSFLHVCPCMVPQENYNASLLRVCVDHIFCGMEHITSHVVNLLCAMPEIAMHGVTTCLIATQRTHLGKHLTTPYYKNTMKRLFS